MHHVSNDNGDFSLCPDYDLLEDGLVPLDETQREGGRWFNCGECFKILHGQEKRPNPPESP